ncbi:MAG: hypothetical protein MK179_21010 [Pirellulaceae bacterium]|nr:hypothetical protein [Pirellulaceae bacterium]
MFKRKSKSDKPAKPKKAKKSRQKPAKSKKKSTAPALPLKKQPTDIYTVMLMISFVAVLIACLLLFLELSTYGSYPWWKAT